MVLIKIRVLLLVLVSICFVGSSLEQMNPLSLPFPRGRKMSIPTTEAPTWNQDVIKVKIPSTGNRIKLTKSDKGQWCLAVDELEQLLVKSIPRFG